MRRLADGVDPERPLELLADLLGQRAVEQVEKRPLLAGLRRSPRSITVSVSPNRFWAMSSSRPTSG
jgi:hypothetical protein